MWRAETRSSNPRDLVFRYFGLIVFAALTPFAINDLYLGRYDMAAADALALLLIFLDFLSVRNRGRVLFPRSLMILGVCLILWYAVYRQGVLGIYWSYVMIVCIYFLLDYRVAVVFNIIFLVGMVPLSLNAVGEYESYRVLVTMMLTGFVAFVFSYIVETQRKFLEEQAITDALTGVFNRRFLQTRLREMIRERSRDEKQLSQILFDIDDFKKLNDKYGHEYGDRVLGNTIQIIRSRIRLTDQIFRHGGDEFVILLPGTGINEARKIAEEIRKLIAESDANEFGPVTISCGVCEHLEDEPPNSWLNRADQAMYKAKNQGRNRVFSACADLSTA